jgi:hypothetical protein
MGQLPYLVPVPRGAQPSETPPAMMAVTMVVGLLGGLIDNGRPCGC